jgi:hypothetical protein
MCGAAALTLAAASHDPVQAASRVDVRLSDARVDMIGKDRIVASFEASGAIRGLFTANIARGPEGALKGEWVLVSRYLVDVTPDGQPDTLLPDERAALPGAELHARHREYFDIRERGTLRGSISGGALSFDVDGRLRSIDSLRLTIDGGDREFAGMSGAGSLTGSDLHADHGIGNVTLTPQAAPAASEVN